MSPDIIRQRVAFQGRVQGVGFRYTTLAIARRYPVVGFVRNLPDGSVELIAEADRLVLEKFLADVASEFAGHIQKHDTSAVPRDEPLSVFEIRR